MSKRKQVLTLIMSSIIALSGKPTIAKATNCKFIAAQKFSNLEQELNDTLEYLETLQGQYLIRTDGHQTEDGMIFGDQIRGDSYFIHFAKFDGISENGLLFRKINASTNELITDTLDKNYFDKKWLSLEALSKTMTYVGKEAYYNKMTKSPRYSKYSKKSADKTGEIEHQIMLFTSPTHLIMYRSKKGDPDKFQLSLLYRYPQMKDEDWTYGPQISAGKFDDIDTTLMTILNREGIERFYQPLPIPSIYKKRIKEI